MEGREPGSRDEAFAWPGRSLPFRRGAQAALAGATLLGGLAAGAALGTRLSGGLAAAAAGLAAVALVAAGVASSVAQRLDATETRRMSGAVRPGDSRLQDHGSSDHALAEVQRLIGEGLDPQTSFAQFAGPLCQLTGAGALALVIPQRDAGQQAWAWRRDMAAVSSATLAQAGANSHHAWVYRVDAGEAVPIDMALPEADAPPGATTSDRPTVVALASLPDGPLRDALGIAASKTVFWIPLTYGGARQGVLLVAWPSGQGVDDERRRMLGIVARQVAATLASARLFAVVATGKRQWERTFDAIPELIYVLDREGVLMRVNRVAAARLGGTPRDFVGRHADQVLRGCHEAFHEVHDIDSPTSVEATCERLHGTFEVTTFPLSGENGDRMGIVRIARDITEQRRLSQQVAQADKMAAIGLIAAGVAHEVNNPVAYIMSNMNSLADELDKIAARFPEPLPDDVGLLFDDLREIAKESHDGCVRIRDIVLGLTTFSRLDAGSEVESIDVVDLMERVLRLTQHEIRCRAEVVRQFDPVPAVPGNQGRLSQVILNLVVNAVQAMESVVDRPRILTVGAHREGAMVALRVADTGSGMTPGVLERIFDPFFTTKDVGKGTGLGLAVARQIVSQHGGEIHVESRPGAGTTFTVTLPALERTAPPQTAGRPFQGHRGRVLIVDDESVLLEVYRRLLGRHHDVLAVGSGREAMDILSRDDDFDAVLCDLMMPVVSGKDLLATVSSRWPDLRELFVFVTGVSSAQVAEFLGPTDRPVLEKPVTDDVLLGIVHGLVEKAAARRGSTRGGRRLAAGIGGRAQGIG